MSNELTRRDFIKTTSLATVGLFVAGYGNDTKAAVAPVDYSDKNNWLRQPEVTKDVDTVYIYPTEYIDESEGAPMFADINEKSMREPAQYTYLMQGTAYEGFHKYFRAFLQANQPGLRRQTDGQRFERRL